MEHVDIYENNDIQWIKTHCARMDHGGCALIVGVKNNRIVSIKGDSNGFLNKGYVCPKGLASAEKLYHPSRLRHPLKRIGDRGEGKWEQITWNEAIQTIGEKFKDIKERYGAKAVAFCQGMPKGLDHFVLIRLANVFGSPNVVATQDVCHAPREVAGMHTCGFYPVADFHHRSRLVILWGSNIIDTNEEGEICKLLMDQLREGTELVVIDPRKTPMSKKARYWLQIRPGTDNALALAFLNVIISEGLFDPDFVRDWTHGFDDLSAHVKNYSPEKVAAITWVPADLIRECARFYASNHPASIQWGNPIEQNIHAFDTSRALVCLMALCGNLDIAGGNICATDPKILGLGQFVKAELIPSKPKQMIHAHHHSIPRLMTVPGAYFRKAVLEEIPYPVKGAYIQCTNPVMAYADTRQTVSALKALDFFAVSDIFMTPTAWLADIVLPAATHFEFNDIGHYGIGHGFILARPKVVDPPEECVPDMEILNQLGKYLTGKEHWHENYEGFLEEILSPTGLSFSKFAEKGYLKGPERFMKYKDKGFKTPSGKVELRMTNAEKFGISPMPEFSGFVDGDDPEYPLILTSAKDPHYLHSSYRWVEKLRKRSPKPIAEIHPETAGKYGIYDGDKITISTRSGQITQYARLTETVHPRVVCAAYGWWFPEEEGLDWQRSNFNMITSVQKLGKELGTPNLKGICCQIGK